MRRSIQRQAVLDVIRAADGPTGPQEIATALDAPAVNVRYLLGRLIKEAAITKMVRGLYRANPVPPVPPFSPPRLLEEMTLRKIGETQSLWPCPT